MNASLSEPITCKQTYDPFLEDGRHLEVQCLVSALTIPHLNIAMVSLVVMALRTVRLRKL
jgi:hypothetical protein